MLIHLNSRVLGNGLKHDFGRSKRGQERRGGSARRLMKACLFQMDVSLVGDFLRHVDLQDSSFCIAVAAIAFNPLFWNTVRFCTGFLLLAVS